MNPTTNLVLKVLVLSIVLSYAVKYGAPYLSIPATSGTALTLVLLPAGIMSGVLFIRAKQHPHKPTP